MLSKEEIKKIIPYQEPFLFVDEVEKIVDNTITGFYQTSANDYYFKGHFVDFKIMPGVLVVEALAQLSTILLRRKFEELRSSLASAKASAIENHKNYHFLAYDVRSCQFLKPIFPGDKISLKAEVLSIYDVPEETTKIARVKGWALVKDDLKCEVRFSVAVVDKKEFETKNVQ
jgi:3-hydroxyacyl-[acyl-carrier-protein] dehydratase